MKSAALILLLACVGCSDPTRISKSKTAESTNRLEPSPEVRDAFKWASGRAIRELIMPGTEPLFEDGSDVEDAQYHYRVTLQFSQDPEALEEELQRHISGILGEDVEWVPATSTSLRSFSWGSHTISPASSKLMNASTRGDTSFSFLLDSTHRVLAFGYSST